MTQDVRKRMEVLSTNNVSDALTALNLSGTTYGVRPIWEGCPRIFGEAITIKMGPAGLTEGQTSHLGVLTALENAAPGSVVVVDHGGRLDVSSWGGIMAHTAQVNKIAGVVIDGVCRDIDEYVEIKFPMYSRGATVGTSRGRTIAYSINEMVQFADVQVRPGDVVIADRSGVVIVPKERFEDVLAKAEELYKKEEDITKDVRNGLKAIEIEQKYNYEKMLKK